MKFFSSRRVSKRPKLLLLVSGGIPSGIENLISENFLGQLKKFSSIFRVTIVVCLWDEAASRTFANNISQIHSDILFRFYRRNENFSKRYLDIFDSRLIRDEAKACTSFGFQFYLMEKCWLENEVEKADLICRIRPDLSARKLNHFLRKSLSSTPSIKNDRFLFSEKDLISTNYQVSDKLFLASPRAAEKIFCIFRKEPSELTFQWSPYWHERYIGERFLKKRCQEDGIEVRFISAKARILRKSRESQSRFLSDWFSKMRNHFVS